jgi:branched-chain amino acid transport system permease protein
VHLPVEWLGPQVLREVVPFVALAVAVAWRGALVPRRGAAAAPRLPPADVTRHPARLLLGVVAVGAVAIATTDGQYRSALIVTMIGALICLSLVVLTGYAGQISLAQMSFAGVAGFSLSQLTTALDVPFPLAPLLAALASGLCAVVVGIPALRARGVSFAVMTLGGALAVNELVFRNLSNGVLEANTVSAPRVAGIDLSAISADGTPTAVFGFFVLAALILSALGVVALRRSRFGRRFVAVRVSERAAASAGINVAATKLMAFGLAGFLAGLGGALMGYHQSVVSEGSFGLGRSFVTLAAAYLGGIGSVAGALVGGLIVSGGVVPTLFDRLLHIGRYQTLLSGIAMVAVAVHNPEGVAAAMRARTARRTRK